MLQLIVHLWGDYVLQNDWQALNKSKKTLNCLVHVLIYTSCFLILTTSWKALLVIGVTHFFIDRFPVIVKRLIYFKNSLNPHGYPLYDHCDTTGYYDDSPLNSKKLEGMDKVLEKPEFWGKPRPWQITIWLYIITDNLLHLTINYLALTYLT